MFARSVSGLLNHSCALLTFRQARCRSQINDTFNGRCTTFRAWRTMHHGLHGPMRSIVERSSTMRLKVSRRVELMQSTRSSLQGPLMFIEADILLGSSTDGPIMAHPPQTISDLTFADFLRGVQASSKGLKLDFKDINALQPCLNELELQKDHVSSLASPSSQRSLRSEHFRRSMLPFFSMPTSSAPILHVPNRSMRHAS